MLINKDDYTETINNVADHLREKHPDHLLLFQHRQDGRTSPKPYYWCSRSYKCLTEKGILAVPIGGDAIIPTAKMVAAQANKSVIIIDNTITVSPYYQIIHPLKQDNEQS